MSLRKVSYKAFVFFCIFEKSGKNKATDLAVSQLWGSTIILPMCQASTCGLVRARCWVQVPQNSGSEQWGQLWSATTSRQFHWNFHFTWKKSDLTLPEIHKALKPCLLLNWVRIARVVACFPQASQSRPAATAADLRTPCVCACPSYPRKQSRRGQTRASRAWDIARWQAGQQGLKLGLKLKLCHLTNEL